MYTEHEEKCILAQRTLERKRSLARQVRNFAIDPDNAAKCTV